VPKFKRGLIGGVTKSSNSCHTNYWSNLHVL